MSRRKSSKKNRAKKGRIEKVHNRRAKTRIEIKASKQKRIQKENKEVVLTLLSIILVVCVIIIFTNLFEKYKTKKDYETIRNSINDNTTVIDENGNERTLTRSEQVKKLQKENEDIIGWLELINTTISYPVLQSDNNSFYMNHNYKKEKSKEGSLFLDKDYDWKKHNSNILIYGHNNTGSTEMFAKLTEYKDKEFYESHKYIRFTTDKEDAEYEIISVFLSRVYNQDEKNVFRYYYFIEADNEEEFNDYVKNAKKSSIYDIETTAEYGDQLITLSTCDYSQKDGRFVVVAKKR